MSNLQKESKTKVRFKTKKKKEKENDSDDDQSDEDSVTKSWCNFQCGRKIDVQLKQSSGNISQLKDEIILDTGSTFSATFTNKKLMVCIRDAQHPMNMNTNAGVRKLTKVRDVIGFGTGWFDEDLLVNIF